MRELLVMASATPPSLSMRDIVILRDLLRVRLLTGRQLERLHFADLATVNARSSARRRSLGRLSRLGLVTTLPRRVGGERAGSAGVVYSLDSKAYRYAELWLEPPGTLPERTRRPWAIGWPFVQHTLDVAELYVRLRERERRGGLRLTSFTAEPASWYRTPAGALKPDAHAIYETGAWEEHWWLEVDRATESMPTIRRKLLAYVDLVNRGDPGPNGVLPRVLVTVPTDKRADDLTKLVASLPAPADQLITIVRFDDAFAARPPP
jgi:hypothetical protein